MSDANKALMRRFYEEVSRGNLAVLDELAAPGFTDHSPMPGQEPGIAGVKKVFEEMAAGFPDMRFTVEHMVAEGDLVAAFLSWSGTHKGTYMGAAPTGKAVTGRVADLIRIANGKAAERWGIEDMMGAMMAIGLGAPPQ